MKKLTLFFILLSLQSFAGVVADTLFMECRGEPAQGRYDVASVIWNRHVQRNQSLQTVCKAKAQFSCWNGRQTVPKPRNNTERAILAELKALEIQMIQGTFRPSVKAAHYYAGKTPYWAKKMKVEKKIGHHIFVID